jgi:hypothetical protein
MSITLGESGHEYLQRDTAFAAGGLGKHTAYGHDVINTHEAQSDVMFSVVLAQQALCDGLKTQLVKRALPNKNNFITGRSQSH